MQAIWSTRFRFASKMSPMPRHHAKRSPCPVACTLDLLGDRWTLLVARDLVMGKTTFDAFLSSPERIATNILADRLKLLADAGLVEKASDPRDGRRSTYRLTPRGESLRGLVQ